MTGARQQRPEEPAAQREYRSRRARGGSLRLGSHARGVVDRATTCSRRDTRGLAAIGREPIDGLTERFADGYLARFFELGAVEESYPGRAAAARRVRRRGDGRRVAALSSRPSTSVGCCASARVDDACPARDAARPRVEARPRLERVDPPELLLRDLATLGVAERLDVAVFSSEVGRRKPDPAIFHVRSTSSASSPAHALFVGDSLATDIAGAAALGMHTVSGALVQRRRGHRGAGAGLPGVHAVDVVSIAGGFGECPLRLCKHQLGDKSSLARVAILPSTMSGDE